MPRKIQRPAPRAVARPKAKLAPSTPKKLARPTRAPARALTKPAIRRNAQSVRERVSEVEWETRVNLAACYRMVADQGWSHLIYNHISARVPDEHDHFLINPYGPLYEEITASSLVKVDLDGNLIDAAEYGINAAGFVIHSAVHAARHDVQCVIHTHTQAGMAVSGLECGLLPFNMGALRFYNRVGYHDYEGVTLDLDERERIVNNLGTHCALILRNHGLMTVGATIPDAFLSMYHLEKSCQTQLMAQATGQPLVIPPQEVCEKSANQSWRTGNSADAIWPAHLRRLDRLDPSYKL